MYTSSFTSAYGTGAGRAGSQSPATLRATTPARNYGAGMASLPEEKRVASPTGSYSGYYSRQKDFYTPSAYSRIYSSDYDTQRRERRTINTEEIDTEEKKEKRREHAIPGEITRDTTLNVRGGKAVVRMVTTKLKESPYAGGWRARMAEREEKEALTLGQRLALKHQIVEKPKEKEKTPPPVSTKADSGEESEWTWETCSSSEAEDPGPPKKRKTPTPPKRKVSPKLIKQKERTPPKPLTPEPPRRAPVAYTKSNTTSLCNSDEKKAPAAPPRNTSTSRWMDRLFGEEKPKPKVPSVRIPNFGNAVSANKNLLDTRVKEQSSPSMVRSSVTGRPLSWAGIPGAANVQDVQANIHTEQRTSATPQPVKKKPPSSSSSGSSSPPLYKYNPRKPQTYKGAGSHLIESSDEEAQPMPGLGRGWRPGQPPRGDVVVKLTPSKTAPPTVINSEHSEALAANRALTSQAAISSKVPAAMGEKYNIPGLFIKPSTKTAPKSIQPVEAKLTLKPEGTMSLTTKTETKPSYQSSIYTPSKSPLLDARVELKVATSSPPPQAAAISKDTEAKATEKKEESGESEWEYYTETEPSDEEEKPADTSSPASTKTETEDKTSEVKSSTQNGVAPVSVSKPVTNGHVAKTTSVTKTPTTPTQTTQSKPSAPISSAPTKVELPPKPTPKKHPVKVEEVTVVDKKRPVQTKSDMSSSKAAVSAVAALRKVKPEPVVPIPEAIAEEDDGSGPGYSAPTTAKPQMKQLEGKTTSKLVEVKPPLKPVSAVKKPEQVMKPEQVAKPGPVMKPGQVMEPVQVMKPGVKVSGVEAGQVMKAGVKVSGVEAGGRGVKDSGPGPAPILPSPSASTGPAKANIKGETLSGKAGAKDEAANLGTLSQTPVKKPGSGNVRSEAQTQGAQVSVGQAKNKDNVTHKNTVANHASEKAEAESKTILGKGNLKTVDNVKAVPNEKLSTNKSQDVPSKKVLEAKVSSAGTANAPALVVSPKPAKKDVTVTVPAPAPVIKRPTDLLSPQSARKDQKAQNSQAAKKTTESLSQISPQKAAAETKAPISPITENPVKNSAAEQSPLSELDSLKSVEFDWTKSPTPMSPKSPSPMSPSPTPQMTAASLDRLPSPLKDMFSKTENSPKEKTIDSPIWFDNVPSDSSVNAMKEMCNMKADANRTQVKKSRDEENLIKVSDVAETPWYDDEDDDMKELLKNRPTILREIDQTQDRRLTPEENMAVIKMYGGVMFPGGEVEKTPKSWLFKIRKALRGNSAEKKKQKDGGLEVPCRGGSNSSTSSSLSSFTDYSKSPSPELRDSSSDSDEDEKDEIFKNPRNEAPTKYRPSFKKYGPKDFKFLRVLGKGSFGKVLLTELRGSQNYYAVKALKKDAVLEDDDIECTMIERKVLALGVKHPFLCHLFCTFQTDSHLFFVMEYLNGGDLMFHIQQQGRFETERARFYSAEIVCALKFLHRKGIVYRDLKLDNLLLDFEGHIRIVDFGMCKLQVYLDKTADTFCGTPDYMAPEIIKGMKYTHSVDWWSFGVLLYEMLIGQSPFNGCDEDELFWSICNEQAYFPRFLSKETKQLLLLLLEKSPANRLGVSDSIHGDIRRQPFFRSIDFDRLEAKQLPPPYKPKLKCPMDVSYFDTAFTDEPVRLTPMEGGLMEGLNQAQFKGFSYTNRVYTK